MTEPHWIIAHLAELKTRLIKSLCVYLIIFAPFCFYAAPWFSLISRVTFPNITTTHLIATEITSPFMIPLKLALFSSFLVCLPYFLWQIWQFIAPALYPKEKKGVVFLALISTCLFYIGTSFALLIVCPMALSFFNTIAPDNITVMTDISYYYDFMINISLAFGVCFEVPIITFMLIYSGIVKITTLTRFRRYIIIMAFVIGMILTPPDIISQIMLAIPLWLLFESGLLMAKYFTPNMKKQEDATCSA